MAFPFTAKSLSLVPGLNFPSTKKSQPYHGPVCSLGRKIAADKDLPSLVHPEWLEGVGLLLSHCKGPGPDQYIHWTLPWRQQQGPWQAQRRGEKCNYQLSWVTPVSWLRLGAYPPLDSNIVGNLSPGNPMTSIYEVPSPNIWHEPGLQSRTAFSQPWTISQSPNPSTSFSS